MLVFDQQTSEDTRWFRVRIGLSRTSCSGISRLYQVLEEHKGLMANETEVVITNDPCVLLEWLVDLPAKFANWRMGSLL